MSWTHLVPVERVSYKREYESNSNTGIMVVKNLMNNIKKYKYTYYHNLRILFLMKLNHSIYILFNSDLKFIKSINPYIRWRFSAPTNPVDAL